MNTRWKHSHFPLLDVQLCTTSADQRHESGCSRLHTFLQLPPNLVVYQVDCQPQKLGAWPVKSHDSRVNSCTSYLLYGPLEHCHFWTTVVIAYRNGRFISITPRLLRCLICQVKILLREQPMARPRSRSRSEMFYCATLSPRSICHAVAVVTLQVCFSLLKLTLLLPLN